MRIKFMYSNPLALKQLFMMYLVCSLCLRVKGLTTVWFVIDTGGVYPVAVWFSHVVLRCLRQRAHPPQAIAIKNVMIWSIFRQFQRTKHSLSMRDNTVVTTAFSSCCTRKPIYSKIANENRPTGIRVCTTQCYLNGWL